jgi:hypothetical protein
VAGGERDVDDALALSIASGLSRAAAAEAAGISLATLYRRLKRAEFRAKIDAARAELLEATVGRLSGLGIRAATTLAVLMAEQSPAAVRLGAARAALEYMLRGNEVLSLARQVEELRRLLERGAGDEGGGPEAGAGEAGDVSGGTEGGPGGGAAEGGPGVGPDGGGPGAGPLAA